MSVSHAVLGRRLFLLFIAVAALTPFAFSQTEEAEAQEHSPIAAAALRHLDTHGGQCWTFMQQVVTEATGKRVGYDYRLGFFEAGAIEVSADEAMNGDIIQIANDANTAPWSYHAGQHTAIILENLGGGRFNAIDSNQNWDEWVRLRPNYDPYASAARYGLQVHIYRIPGGSIGASAPAVPDLGEGEGAVVAADGGCLNLRTDPSLSGGRITCLPAGTNVTVTGAAVEADGYSWVPVSTPSGSGWVASNYLVGGAAPVTELPASEPVAAPAAADESPAEEVTATTDDSPGCLRVRSDAGTDSKILDCLAAGTVVTLGSEEAVSADEYSWVKVRIPGRVEGWVASEYLIR